MPKSPSARPVRSSTKSGKRLTPREPRQGRKPRDFPPWRFFQTMPVMALSVRTARLLLLGAFVAYAGWMLAVGLATADQVARAAFGGPLSALQYAALAYKPLLTIAGTILLAVRVPELARRAGMFPARVLVLLSFVGIVASWAGAAAHFEPAFGFWPLGRAPTWNDVWPLGFACGLLGIAVLYIAPTPPATAEPFFLIHPTHTGI